MTVFVPPEIVFDTGEYRITKRNGAFAVEKIEWVRRIQAERLYGMGRAKTYDEAIQILLAHPDARDHVIHHRLFAVKEKNTDE